MVQRENMRLPPRVPSKMTLKTVHKNRSIKTVSKNKCLPPYHQVFYTLSLEPQAPESDPHRPTSKPNATTLSYGCIMISTCIFAYSIPDPVRRVRTTRSPIHSHPFQVTLPNPRTLVHNSPFIPRTSQLWNSLPLTTFPVSQNLSSLKSIINKLDLVSLST